MVAEMLPAAQLKSTDTQTVRNMMSRPLIQIDDLVRPMTDEEFEAYEAKVAKEAAEEQAKLDAIEEAKAKREVLLNRLGITQDEANLLLNNG